jgi:DNA polymerase-3 subunit delta'
MSDAALESPASWPIVGHEAAVELLARGARSGRVVNAYLIAGPAAIGKFTLARTFAQSLNCGEPGAPCGACRTCRLIADDRHPDVRVMQMPADKREIGIDQVRALQHEASLRPYEASWKVNLIRDAENLSEEAANALLKTLEEPPARVTLVLTASSPESMLATIVSRCLLISLHPLPLEQVEAHLRDQLAVPADRARLLARLSAGRIGWAISAARDPQILDARGQLVDRLASLSRASRVDRLAFGAEYGGRYTKDVAEREVVHAMLDLWSGWWRDVLLTSTGCADRVRNADRTEALEQAAGHIAVPQVRAFLRELALAGARLRQNVNPRLTLEVLALSAPKTP